MTYVYVQEAKTSKAVVSQKASQWAWQEGQHRAPYKTTSCKDISPRFTNSDARGQV